MLVRDSSRTQGRSLEPPLDDFLIALSTIPSSGVKPMFECYNPQSLWLYNLS